MNGSASVRLEPTFAASIDMATPYRVFLTPDDDTRGLYVATKTASGFVVRETQTGRSTLSFDYRIVAMKFGAAGQRMAVVPASLEPRTGAAASARPRSPKPHVVPPSSIELPRGGN